MSTIQVDYINARYQASRLYGAASDCAAASQALKAICGDIPNYWEGEAAQMYITALWKRIAELDSLDRELTNLAGHIKYVTDELEAAEARLTAEMSGSTDGSSGGDGGIAGNGGGGGGGHGF